MSENAMTVTIPRDEYDALIRAQLVIDIIRNECAALPSYDFTAFVERLLGVVKDAPEAK